MERQVLSSIATPSQSSQRNKTSHERQLAAQVSEPASSLNTNFGYAILVVRYNNQALHVEVYLREFQGARLSASSDHTLSDFRYLLVPCIVSAFSASSFADLNGQNASSGMEPKEAPKKSSMLVPGWHGTEGSPFLFHAFECQAGIALKEVSF